MILVLLGTQDKSFQRLLQQIDHVIEKKQITDEVIVQAGYTKYESNNMKIFDFLDKESLEELIDKADIIISHAGVGSLLSGIKKEKRIIAVPRLKKYKEHTNDHQMQILKEFVSLGYVLPLYDMSQLEKLLKKIQHFQPKKYENKKKINGIIEDYIDQIKDRKVKK